MRWFLLLVVAVESAAFAGPPENWSQFRGPRGNGIAPGRRLPVTWSPTGNIVWKAEIPGLGWSQPAVWENRIFVTTAVSEKEPVTRELDWSPGASGLTLLLATAGQKVDFPPPDANYEWKVFCLDGETGKVIWERTPATGKPRFHIHPSNSYASETPATDGQVVVVSFGMTGLFAFDLDGAPLWSKDLGVQPTQLGWGTGSSPVLHAGRVFVQCDNDGSSFVAALDAKTGDAVWRIPREERSNWATPVVWKNRLRSELVTAGGGKMRSYDLADGTLLWEMKASGRTAATPLATDDLLYVDSYERLQGRTGILAAIRPGASGDISLHGKESTSEWIAWSHLMSGYRVCSPAIFDERLFLFEQNGGIVHCFNAKTGEKVYKQRLPSGRGVVASPLATDSHLYVVNYDGTTAVLQPGPELKVAASNAIGAITWASPAVIGDRLLLRSAGVLYCIGSE
jgi:outer membrane protein assembly factor BamB